MLVLDTRPRRPLRARCSHPEVRVRGRRAQTSARAGHNLLAARHDAAALLFLNPDTRFVEPRTVERMLAALTGDVHAVGPADRVRDGRVGPARPRRAARLPRARGAGRGHQPLPAARRAGRRGLVPAPPCLVARHAFDGVGGLRSGFFSTRRRRTCSCGSGRRAGACATCRRCACGTTARRSPRATTHMPDSGGALRGKHISLAGARRVIPHVHTRWRSGAGGSTA